MKYDAVQELAMDYGIYDTVQAVEFVNPAPIKTVGENFPCGPCKLPLKCHCGEIVTSDNVVFEYCEDDCEFCNSLFNDKCPYCGAHIHCGGCL